MTDRRAPTTLALHEAAKAGTEGGTTSPERPTDTDSGLAHGHVLAGRYEIQAELGRGGGSRVFRAYDRATKTAVAVKVVTGAAATDNAWLERLGRELQMARQVRYRHVCEVYDLMEADGHRFLTMPLAVGGTLRDTLVGSPDRPWAERLADMEGVISGLAALHTAGIIHRDVKPENVLRMADGRLALSDFGLAPFGSGAIRPPRSPRASPAPRPPRCLQESLAPHRNPRLEQARARRPPCFPRAPPRRSASATVWRPLSLGYLLAPPLRRNSLPRLRLCGRLTNRTSTRRRRSHEREPVPRGRQRAMTLVGSLLL
jgi:serine/threonine protein kinase